jgi:predicted Rossmann fold nucleotide-binding protein DprA/Smf involved in DNA uptake
LVYECLHREPTHIEQVIMTSQLPAGSVNASIVSLRLKGLVKQLPGNMFVRK